MFYIILKNKNYYIFTNFFEKIELLTLSLLVSQLTTAFSFNFSDNAKFLIFILKIQQQQITYNNINF